MIGTFILPSLLGYLIGSIPFGLILTRVFGAGDVRAIGSGSIGATNVLRTGRKGLAAATLLLDMGKGAFAVWSPFHFGNAFGELFALAAALGALIGHCCPVWLRFKGGKGVATMLGITLALAWPIGLISALVWLVVAALSRISSVSGMASAVAAPLVAIALGHREMAAILALIAVIILWKHRSNIARLRVGTEPKIGAKS